MKDDGLDEKSNGAKEAQPNPKDGSREIVAQGGDFHSDDLALSTQQIGKFVEFDEPQSVNSRSQL